MKVVTPPNDASSTWLMKIESANAATFAELALTASQEGARLLLANGKHTHTAFKTYLLRGWISVRSMW